MRPARARVVAVSAGWLLAMTGAAALFAAGTLRLPIYSDAGFSLVFLGLAVDITAYASVGALLALRRPENVIGAVLLAAALMIAITFNGFIGGAVLAYLRGAEDMLAATVLMVGGLTITATLVIAGPAAAIAFPDGRLPGPRWRWPVALLGLAIILAALPNVLRPGPMGEDLPDNPFAVVRGPMVDLLLSLGSLLDAVSIPAALGMALVAVAVRFRRSRAVERQQLKWFVGANVLVAIGLGLSIGDGATGVTVLDILAVASLSLPPLAIGIAVLRYRLYEIDRLISRSIGWALVTGVLVAVFAGLVVGLQAALAAFTQGETLAVAASTLAAFALFQPLRRRVQAAVDRRFDRARYDGEQTVATFAARLRDEVDLVTLSDEVRRAAGETVRPVSATVWLRNVPDHLAGDLS